MIEMEEDGIDAKFKQIFEYIQHGKSYHISFFSFANYNHDSSNTILSFCWAIK